MAMVPKKEEMILICIVKTKNMCPREFQKHVKKLVASARQLGTNHRGDIGSNNARQKRRFSVIGTRGEKYPADYEIFHKAYSMIQLHSGLK